MIHKYEKECKQIISILESGGEYTKNELRHMTGIKKIMPVIYYLSFQVLLYETDGNSHTETRYGLLKPDELGKN